MPYTANDMERCAKLKEAAKHKAEKEQDFIIKSTLGEGEMLYCFLLLSYFHPSFHDQGQQNCRTKAPWWGQIVLCQYLPSSFKIHNAPVITII